MPMTIFLEEITFSANNEYINPGTRNKRKNDTQYLLYFVIRCLLKHSLGGNFSKKCKKKCATFAV